MNNFLAGLDWQTVGAAALLLTLLLMLVLFQRPPADSEKALKVGIGFFILTILFNVIGLIEISNYLAILGFVMITFALLRIFWAESKH